MTDCIKQSGPKAKCVKKVAMSLSMVPGVKADTVDVAGLSAQLGWAAVETLRRFAFGVADAMFRRRGRHGQAQEAGL